MATDERIIIGEGVILDTRPASFATRGLALGIDLAAVLILFIALVQLLPITWLTLSDYAPAVTVLIMVFILVIFPTTVEFLSHGRSLGKWAMGVQVVRDDGGPISARQAFIRAMVGVGELWLTLGSVALITSIVNPRGKRLGDLMAGTFVIRVRGGGPKSAPIFMPPHLATWAQSADMAQLPDRLALSARQFLSRTNTLHPGSRQLMAQDFATQLSTRVAPAPPAGTHPEDFIAAVIIERSRREQLSEANKQVAARELQSQLETLPHGIDNPVQ